jgi:hypothetical protein
MIDTGVCVKSRTPTCSPNNVDRKALSIEHACPPLSHLGCLVRRRDNIKGQQESPQEVVRGGNTLGVGQVAVANNAASSLPALCSCHAAQPAQ